MCACAALKRGIQCMLLLFVFSTSVSASSNPVGGTRVLASRHLSAASSDKNDDERFAREDLERLRVGNIRHGDDLTFEHAALFIVPAILILLIAFLRRPLN